MTSMEQLLELDGPAHAFHRRVKAEEAAVAAATERRIVTAVLSEIEAISIFVSVSSSIANAAQQPMGVTVHREALISYLPPDSALATNAVPSLLGCTTDGEAIAMLQIFQMRLALAKRMSVAFVAESSAANGARTVLADTLADAWQRTCSSALNAINALRRMLPEGPRDRALAGVGRVTDLLKAAQRGEHPCVEVDGTVVVPGWAERRRAKRARMALSCAVRVGDRILSASIHDISMGGMGLTGITDVERGSIMDVELPSGRRLSGTVAWTSLGEAKVGVKFASPLSSDDPILPNYQN
jgi:hypothetical protein